MKTSGWFALLALLLLPGLVTSGEAVPEVTAAKLQAALPKLEQLAETTLKKMGVPGLAIAVVHQDRVVYLKGFGVRAAGKDEPVDPDTVFQLASVSKPITSTLLALLVSLGLIDWDERVIDHAPDFQLSDPWATRQLTFRDLLCHRSGLAQYIGDELLDLGYDQKEIFRRLRFPGLGNRFRATYAYNNAAYSAAGFAAARAAKQSWADLCTEKLFRPLGMKSTSARHADFAAAKNRALLHVAVNGQWVAKYSYNGDACSPAGGICSTARDLAQWLRLQLADGRFAGKRLIGTHALRETRQPQIISGFDTKADKPSLYGLGWNFSRDEKGRVFNTHSGAFMLGVRTEVALLPAEQLGIAVLSNAAPTGLPEGIRLSFFDLVLNGKLEKDWVKLANDYFARFAKEELGQAPNYTRLPVDPSAPLPTSAYLGTYRNDYCGELEISEKGGKLLLMLGVNRRSFPLRHWDRDNFLYDAQGEAALGLRGVFFRISPQQHATSVVIENLEVAGKGLGTFVRVVGPH